MPADAKRTGGQSRFREKSVDSFHGEETAADEARQMPFTGNDRQSNPALPCEKPRFPLPMGAKL